MESFHTKCPPTPPRVSQCQNGLEASPAPKASLVTLLAKAGQFHCHHPLKAWFGFKPAVGSSNGHGCTPFALSRCCIDFTLSKFTYTPCVRLRRFAVIVGAELVLSDALSAAQQTSSERIVVKLRAATVRVYYDASEGKLKSLTLIVVSIYLTCSVCL